MSAPCSISDVHAALAATHRMEARLQNLIGLALDNQRLSPSALAFLNAALNYALPGAARIEVALDRVEHADKAKA